MSYANQSKNPSTYVGDTKHSSSPTWDESTFTWDASNPATWENVFVNQAKDTSIYTGQTKSA